jgi:hypothetical protein
VIRCVAVVEQENVSSFSNVSDRIFLSIEMNDNHTHVPFVSRSGIFDWERTRLEAEHRARLFPPPVASLTGSPLYGSVNSIGNVADEPPLICRPDLHQDHVSTKYTLRRPMPSSYHCLLDPTRRLHSKIDLDEQGDNVTISVPGLSRFDRHPPLPMDMSMSNGSHYGQQADFTWYHNNEPNIGQILPVNYWNRHKLAGTSPSSYLVPTIL